MLVVEDVGVVVVGPVGGQRRAIGLESHCSGTSEAVVKHDSMGRKGNGGGRGGEIRAKLRAPSGGGAAVGLGWGGGGHVQAVRGGRVWETLFEGL